MLTVANTYTGGTTISGGTLQVGNDTNTTASLGSGTINLAGGAVYVNYSGSNYSSFADPIVLTANSTIGIMQTQQLNLQTGNSSFAGNDMTLTVNNGVTNTEPLYFNSKTFVNALRRSISPWALSAKTEVTQFPGGR